MSSYGIEITPLELKGAAWGRLEEAKDTHNRFLRWSFRERLVLEDYFDQVLADARQEEIAAYAAYAQACFDLDEYKRKKVLSDLADKMVELGPEEYGG